MVLATLDKLLIIVQKALDAGTLVHNDFAGQLLPAAADGALAAQDDIAAVRTGFAVQIARIQQAGIAAHFGAFKSAGNAGRVIVQIGGALQHGPLGQIDFQIAVQPQCACQEIARRHVQDIVCATVIDGPLQIVGVQDAAVAPAEIGCLSNVDTALLMPELQRGGAHAVAAADDVHPEGTAVAEPLDGEMGLVGAADDLTVQRNRIFRPGRCRGGLVPVQHRVILGAAYIQIALFHW